MILCRIIFRKDFVNWHMDAIIRGLLVFAYVFEHYRANKKSV